MEIKDRVTKVLDAEKNQDIIKDLLKEYRLRTGAGPATAAEVLKATIGKEHQAERINTGVTKFGTGFRDLHFIEDEYEKKGAII